MDARAPILEERVLVLMPSERDTERTVHLLAEASLDCTACANLPELCRELAVGAGAVLLTDDILSSDSDQRLEESLRKQPTWSALPVLLLTRESPSAHVQQRSLGGYNHIVIVERPVRVRSLVSAVRSALRARQNQYDIRDAIREREQQALALSAQDEKLRFALTAGRLGSWELDPKTESYDCSEICKANHGRSFELPFTFAEYKDSIHPQDRERVDAALAHSLDTGEQYDIEYRVVWPNGETHWLMVRGRAVYDALGRPTRMAGVSLDVTERKRLHEALLQSQSELAEQAEQLRTADRLKDEFLATLAHELRNPLAPIRTGLSLLSESQDPQLTQKTLGVMQRQVRHMVHLIDDLLDVSRITRGKLELKRERLELASVIEAAVEASLPALQRAQHTLHTRLSTEPLLVDGDHTRLAQVISNLLNNASKYTPNGGVIELSVRRERGTVAIAVADNGLGIPAGCLEDVFQMFNQVNQALHRAEGGLGIGLALVRRLVQMHGGSVVAESPGLNQGSTFTVRLPLVEGVPLPAERTAQRFVAPSAQERILVVDDNDDAAELLSLMLEQAGYQTTTVYDGFTALQAAHELTPNIVILDIGLPGMTGYEVAERLRQDERLADTALIALTGWGTPEDRRRAMAAGFDVHLTKPVAAEDLRVALGRAESARRQRSAPASR